MVVTGFFVQCVLKMDALSENRKFVYIHTLSESQAQMHTRMLKEQDLAQCIDGFVQVNML